MLLSACLQSERSSGQTVLAMTAVKKLKPSFCEITRSCIAGEEVTGVLLSMYRLMGAGVSRVVVVRESTTRVQNTKPECWSDGIRRPTPPLPCRQQQQLVMLLLPLLRLHSTGWCCRNRIRMFPSLVNCTTIDWFSEWPQEALLEVADRYLEDMQFATDEEVRQTLFSFACLHFPPFCATKILCTVRDRHQLVISGRNKTLVCTKSKTCWSCCWKIFDSSMAELE